MAKAKSAGIIPIERIAAQIYLIRGEQVILDSGLATLYGVSTGRLNEQVTRNASRFPEDFMFQLTRERTRGFKIANCDLKARKGTAPQVQASCVH